MKKLALLLSLLGLMLALAPSTSNAQTVPTGKFYSTLGGSVDSIRCISNTANYLYIAPTLNYKCGAYQASVTRVSSAIGGTIFLQGSVDGTNWYTATYYTGDTLTVANSASQTGAVVLKANEGLPYKYYRLKCTGASSDTMTVKATFVGRY